MSIWQGVRKLAGRARTGAGRVMHGASVRLDLRNLEGRRDHLLRSIGRRVLALHEEGRAIPEFAAVCEQVREVERSIADTRAELGHPRAKAGHAADASGA